MTLRPTDTQHARALAALTGPAPLTPEQREALAALLRVIDRAELLPTPVAVTALAAVRALADTKEVAA
ncbi:hypothetical protein LX15_004785 [Streptoalloteichus tenebrarius]|uniref:Uncharacterized protein n=1 Tax=Streptoalloteichus tenebrarius (strain ATCC 17920 / DSM 40477 / JCM 4838 / CBS 697.72 / NBRC 16177 / NCIMB 11028 / NRRL B-12390 / A12253. 1 / ISP 5477) TaxID=1933 RepID=A0ABT1I0D6_STRSD|nr:hypothetical protein [Streptoalloteichus tenebrarius]MCP2261065.1 hypothetical protein [Streptoalloteichus tenebrarius]BFF03139.1 hypothetical protein GCM10020241_48140 [Streptoalloteichus tenebrarius]